MNLLFRILGFLYLVKSINSFIDCSWNMWSMPPSMQWVDITYIWNLWRSFSDLREDPIPYLTKSNISHPLSKIESLFLLWKQTSQELGMMPSVSLNCQVTMIVMNSSFQLSLLKKLSLFLSLSLSCC